MRVLPIWSRDVALVVIKTPIFRKTEISDADLNALAAYLSRNTKTKSNN